jgi:hypothetical protein
LAQFRARWTLNDLVCHRVVDLPTPPMPAFIVRCVQCNAQIWVSLNSPSDVKRDLYALRQDGFANPIVTHRPLARGSAIHTGAIECVTKKDRLMAVLLNEHVIAKAQRVLMRIEAGWPDSLKRFTGVIFVPSTFRIDKSSSK